MGSLLMEFALPLVVAAIGVWIAFAIVVWATGRDSLLDIAPAVPPLGLGEGEPVTEAAVASVRFDTGMRGYRTDQVDAALNRLAWEIGRRDELLAEMRTRLDGTADTGELFSPEEDDALRIANEGTTGDLGTDALDSAVPEGAASDSEAGREEPGETATRSEA
ncbi:DivIVA domain-containing protein [Glycomyces niveus]|uniref:DivIVA domain-containing protein n=1 Tax=Glycomyces niveus TaxID=2820287 RepID=A0ABS3U1N6_9ACTN|nr:DivIVA domain-containing protein [Glycomyces sp. NEAU-S30]MBO3732679.1 DivIVA domain-containing protein [Glycomyces sp. NEAU-S30]